jgi:hypothetical protein
MSKAQLKALMTVMSVSDFNQAPKAEAITEFRQAHGQALLDGGQLEIPGV